MVLLSGETLASLRPRNQLVFPYAHTHTQLVKSHHLSIQRNTDNADLFAGPGLLLGVLLWHLMAPQSPHCATEKRPLGRNGRHVRTLEPRDDKKSSTRTSSPHWATVSSVEPQTPNRTENNTKHAQQEHSVTCQCLHTTYCVGRLGTSVEIWGNLENITFVKQKRDALVQETLDHKKNVQLMRSTKSQNVQRRCFSMAEWRSITEIVSIEN